MQHVELSTDVAKAEQLLSVHNESVSHMQNCVFEVIQRGQDLQQVGLSGHGSPAEVTLGWVHGKSLFIWLLWLLQVLEQTGVELMADRQYDAPSRIQALLEFLHERELDLEDLAEQKLVKLDQCLQLRQFENDARQVSLLLYLRCSKGSGNSPACWVIAGGDMDPQWGSHDHGWPGVP